MSPIAEIPQDKESEILRQIKSWTLNQEEGRIYHEPGAITYRVRGFGVATITETNPKVLVCDQKLANKLKKTGLIFQKSQLKK